MALTEAGAIGPLIELVRSGTEMQQELGAWVLRCLAGNADSRVLMASSGGIEALAALGRWIFLVECLSQ